jgi:outer membrane protein
LKQNTKLSLKKGRQLEAEIKRFKQDASIFKVKHKRTVKSGLRKGAELQKENNSYAQQALSQQLQQESGTEMDTLVSGVKKFIKAYGKEKGYAYIYGTGDAASILYAEEKYDIKKIL